MNEMPRKPRPLWLRLLKGLFFLVLLLVIAFVVVGLFVLDGKIDLSRSTTMKATPPQVHAFVGDLNEWPKWLPFVKHDKSVKTTIVQATGVGANQHWTSDHGDGELKFTASDENKGVEYDMKIIMSGQTWPSVGIFSYDKAGDDTKVTWRMTGQYDGLMGHWLAFAMPYMVGPQFDEGLTDLKNLAEKKK